MIEPLYSEKRWNKRLLVHLCYGSGRCNDVLAFAWWRWYNDDDVDDDDDWRWWFGSWEMKWRTFFFVFIFKSYLIIFGCFCCLVSLLQLPSFTCFQIPDLFTSSLMFILVNGIFIILPFANDIWRLPDGGKPIVSFVSCGIFNYGSHTHTTHVTLMFCHDSVSSIFAVKYIRCPSQPYFFIKPFFYNSFAYVYIFFKNRKMNRKINKYALRRARRIKKCATTSSHVLKK